MVVLGQRAHRFNELHRGIETISRRMLTPTLLGLEETPGELRDHPTKRPRDPRASTSPCGAVDSHRTGTGQP